MEEWKDIEGYEGLYQVSNYGRVKSLERIIKSNRIGRTRLIGERILKQMPNSSDYSRVRLTKNNNKKSHSVHRLVALHFIPNPENKPEVNHDDGDKTNNHISNLYWATRQENIDHAVEAGLNAKGEKQHFNKLKETDVVEIINTIKKTSQSYVSLAKDYGVNKATIHHINKGNTWSWLLPEIERPIRPIDSRFSNNKKMA